MALQTHFHRSLFVLVLLGMIGFALAAESPAVWILGGAALFVNAWLVRTRRFTPLPPIAANILAIAALLVVGRELFYAGAGTGLLVAQFLFALMLAKLWQKRTPRDDAQILLLSIIVTGVGALNATSIFFGILLLVYVPLALYCCMLHHLLAAARREENPAAVWAEPGRLQSRRQEQMLRSLRRVVSSLAIPSFLIAAMVFVFFPRGRADGGTQQQNPSRNAESVTGFNDEVELGRLTRIGQSNEVVAYVEVSHDGQTATGTESLLLRGITLDRYTRDEASDGLWRWSRTSPPGQYQTILGGDNMPTSLRMTSRRWTQRIMLQPTGARVLFEIAGPLTIAPKQNIRLRFGRDEGLELDQPVRKPLEYVIVSSGSPGVRSAGYLPAAAPSADDPVLKFALRPEVSGTDAKGPLVARRSASQTTPDALDETIAANISRYLHAHFQYTLDLTQGPPPGKHDPITNFLYEQKQGNCEYFAGAMTLMCQRLGLRARMVAGYRCDEYNAMTRQYVVRQSQAHTWVEVLTPKGWKTFDPTSDRISGEPVRQPNLLLKTAHFFEWIELAYAVHVIAFDNSDRDRIVDAIRERSSQVSVAGMATWNGIQRGLGLLGGAGQLSAIGAGGLLTLVLLFLALAAVWLLARRALRPWKNRDSGKLRNDTEEQRRLREQLQFYEELMNVLEFRKAIRPPGLTQLEFSQSLQWLPPDIYAQLQKLTNLFYRVRFGHRSLSTARRERLSRVVSSIRQRLEAADLQTAPAQSSVG